MKLTKHQQRILAALLELERVHDCRWWSRDAIGCVVAAGGYHQTIQRRSMLTLSTLGLVLLEVESWPREARRLVRCNCAAYTWGLTEVGRTLAASFRIVWPDDAAGRVVDAKYHDCIDIQDPCEGRTVRGDRFVPPELPEMDDDDDDPADAWKR
jgi:hypothetical protein